MEKQEFVIVTGMSGAGKSLATKCLEDLGFFCVDNLPPALIPKFAELCAASSVNRLALVIDVRGRSFFPELQESLNKLPKLGFEPKIIFLEASETVLVRRYSETRRRHPLARDGGILQGIQQEGRELAGLRKMAHRIFDTSSCSPHQLMTMLQEIFDENSGPGRTTVHVVSFGFKHGVPTDADMALDVRFISNPYYIPELRRLSGLDAPVRNFVLDRADTREFMDKAQSLLLFLLPAYYAQGKQHFTLAIGCTGGQHRSTAIAERFARILRLEGYSVSVQHRDLERAMNKEAATAS